MANDTSKPPKSGTPKPPGSKPSQAQSGKQVEGHKRTGDAMTRDDIATERAVEAPRSCVVVVACEGDGQAGRLGQRARYRGGLFNIECRPDQGQLDIWSGRRVLSVERFRGKPQVIHYVPGPWELHLIEAVKVAA